MFLASPCYPIHAIISKEVSDEVKNKSVLWLFIVALLIIVPLLAACGGAAPPPTEKPPAPPPTQEQPVPPPPPKEEQPPPPPPAATPTATPHTLEGRTDCLMCHTSGDHAVPADHDGRTNDTCTTCHKPAG